MKKSIIATLGGVLLGIVLMIGVFSILNMKPNNEDMMAQNSVETDKDENVSVKDEDEFLSMDSIINNDNTEDETATEVESDSKSESVDNNNVANTANTSSKHPYYIKVNRQANCVTVYTLDADGNYTVPIKAMTCSVGLNNSTRLGVSKISDRYAWRYLFGNVYGQYAVRFNGHILFHSVPYMTSTNDTLKEGQFNLLGEPASLGCVRLCVADVKWIYDNCARGTTVEVYDSPDPGPLGKPSMPKINPNSPYRGWDPTDPNPANPWLQGVVTIYGVTNVTVTAGQSVDLLAGVSATDVDGMGIGVTVNGDVNFGVPGTYNITYSATGVLGSIANVPATVTVLPSVTETPSVEVPSTETPSTETPSTEIPSTETPSTETPSTEVPSTETLGTEAPSTEVPGTEVPGTEIPGTEVPNSETPATEVLTTETLGAETQSVDVPETQSVEAPDTDGVPAEN